MKMKERREERREGKGGRTVELNIKDKCVEK